MRKFCILFITLFASWAVNAQTVIDIGAIDTAYTTTFNGDLVIDVATTTSKAASPKVSFTNPFKGLTFSEAQISFDVYTYHPDSIKVLGCLLAIFDPTLGRMYFSNGSYLGYNAGGNWFDANLMSYAMDSNFIGTGVWKNIKLQFTATGYAMYVDNVLAFNQSSTDVTIGGSITDYSNVISFLQNAATLMIGTGSWWSDNQRTDGSYWDCQFSYLKNIKCSPDFSRHIDISEVDTAYTKTVGEDLVIDVAKTASTEAAPNLWYPNPLKGKTFASAEVSFDVYTYYPDSIKVLGCLLAFFDNSLGRMYFSNGSYLGYNANGAWFDANLKSYAVDKDFIGTGSWKNIRLQFTAKGYTMYVDNALAFNQSSTDVTISGILTDYSNVISFLQNADTLVIGTGSWWSSNSRTDGTFYDCQFSYLKNINITPDFELANSLVNLGGNMEDPSKWNVYWGSNAPDTGTYQFNYRADVPAAGKGGCYRVTAAGQAANMLWQPVPIIPGHQYSLTGAYKYLADTAVNVWVEYFITRVKPTGGEITTAMGWSLNTWMAANNVNFDGTFQDNFTLANTKSSLILIPDTVTQTEWYLCMKAGCWNTAGDTTPVYDLLFDEIFMYDMGVPKVTVLPIAKVVVGSVDSPADYTGQVSLSWDADSLYMVYDIVDDSIVNMGASYQVDNLEIYFDMDNSKNIHYPRNGGWVQAVDAAYDTNDYQLRLVPDVPFATNNTPKPGISISDTSVNQVYTRTANGYQFVLNIAWSGLMNGFEPAADKLIGFDVLLSDNDKSASDANRNQITWNSPTAFPFNDPSLFGVLKFVGIGPGYFEAVPDNEKPTAPATVTATLSGSDVVVTWDASTDNRVVQQYIVNNNTAAVQAVDTILAKKTDNTYTVTGLKQGKKYTFGIVAIDVYGNKSSKTNAAEIEIPVGIEKLAASGMMVYPNPSNGIFNVSNEGDASVSLEVYNLTGGLVTSTVFTHNTMLDLSKYSKGVYFLHLNAEGKTQITKLIVQ